MKHLRRLSVTLILIIAFANVTSADEGIMYPGYAPPPPPPSNAGIMYPGKTATSTTLESEEQRDGSATELMLSIVQNLLLLF